MADEQAKLTQAEETPTSPDAPLEAVQADEVSVRDARAMPVETLERDDIPEAVQQLQDLETPEAREARRAQEAALNKPIEAIENAIERIDDQPSQVQIQAEIAHHEDSPVVITLGAQTYTFNTNIYTFVFGLLGALTIFEIIVAELLPSGLIRTLVLSTASIFKALLVMAFYMHLREDNRIFAAAIALPFFIATLAILFLLAVPQTGYTY
ncbi:MAG: cytochrome C oxidase subunit IV family protein [bacterium]|nr:cytochrome C oxidase subunit IV family protein [bacterium]